MYLTNEPACNMLHIIRPNIIGASQPAEGFRIQSALRLQYHLVLMHLQKIKKTQFLTFCLVTTGMEHVRFRCCPCITPLAVFLLPDNFGDVALTDLSNRFKAYD